jgi:hypothetical protein
MSSYTRRNRVSDLSRFLYTVKPADDEVRTDYDTKKASVQSPVQDSALVTGLTLDDFGGRSDALGG